MTEQTMATTPQNPFIFLFYYQLPTGDEVDNVLLRDQANTVSPLHLMIGNALEDKNIVLVSSSTKDANENTYHFKLQFKPEVLLEPNKISVVGNEWSIFYKQDENKGDTVYLLWKGEENITLTSNNSIELILNGVATNSSSIGTDVTLHWEYKLIEGNINIGPKVGGQDDPYTTNSTVYLRIKKYQGNPNIPLFVGFTGSNRVLNTNAQKSSLQLRLTNISNSNTPNSAITFDSESKLIVALEVGDLKTVWALGTKDKVDDIDVNIDGWKMIGEGPQEVKAGDTVKALEWTFEPTGSLELTAQETLLVNLKDIETDHPTGMTNLYLRYKDVPRYQDGEFICPIEKAPLVFHEPDKNVGIGTTTPAQSLHINNGNAVISGNVGIGTTSPLAKLHVDGGNAIFQGGNVGIATTSPSAKLHVDGGNAIFQGGNIGIGTDNPNAKLEVVASGSSEQLVSLRGDNDLSLALRSSNNQAEVYYELADGNNGIDNSWKIGTNNDGKLHFGYGVVRSFNDNEKVTILTNGNVGIGTTSPSAKLDVYGGNAIFQGGNVGIGTTDPKSKLHVVASRSDPGTGAIIIENHGEADISFKDTANDQNWQAGTNQYGWYVFDDDYRLVINKGGNVGIGTTDPKGKLDVYGKIRINGEPAMQLITYDRLDPSVDKDTGMSSQKWQAIIAGFEIIAEGDIEGLKVILDDKNGKWLLRWDANDSDDTFAFVRVLYIKKEFFE